MIRQDDRDDAGFTLIELLMVIILLGVVGSITTAGIAGAMRSTRQNQALVLGSAQLETQLQRMTRDIRVADPLRAVSASSVLFDDYRSGACRRTEYRVSGGSLQSRVLTYSAPASCNAYPATVTADKDTGYVTTAANVTTAAPFTFLDSTGAVIATPTAKTVRQIGISLTQTQRESRKPITMSATVYLRNAT
jgi:prepilin-type N-terminal cleavage/methylation domain-containing protein